MLPASSRLFKESDFKRLALKGRFTFGVLFNLKVLRNPEEVSCFGVVISAKVSKKATVRNLIKRRKTDAIRLMLPELKIGFDAMLIVKKEAIGMNYKAIEAEIRKVFKKAGLFI